MPDNVQEDSFFYSDSRFDENKNIVLLKATTTYINNTISHSMILTTHKTKNRAMENKMQRTQGTREIFNKILRNLLENLKGCYNFNIPGIF